MFYYRTKKKNLQRNEKRATQSSVLPFNSYEELLSYRMLDGI